MTENRFKSLIDPIKDIAENWNIDIADSLDAYLEELESLKLTYEGNNELNFAEAALLIQGSTNVYSKKVEYLYQLVLKAIEYITTKKTCDLVNNTEKNKLSKLKNSQNNISILDDERLLLGSDPSFLLLDDIVEESDNIDIIDDIATTQITNHGKTNSTSFISKDYSRHSMMLMNSILQDDFGSSTLKMSSCKVDTSGALILNGINSLDYDNLNTTTLINKSCIATSNDHDKDKNDYISTEYNNDMNYDYDDNDFPMIDPPIENNGTSKEKTITGREYQSNQEKYITDQYFLRSNLTDPIRSTNIADQPIPVVPIIYLDPHDTRNDSKPFKKGITYSLPKITKVDTNMNIEEDSKAFLMDRFRNSFKSIDINSVDEDASLSDCIINSTYCQFQQVSNNKKSKPRKVPNNFYVDEFKMPVNGNNLFNHQRTAIEKNNLILLEEDQPTKIDDEQYVYHDAYDGLVTTPYRDNQDFNINDNNEYEVIREKENLYWENIDDNDYGVSNIISELNEEEELAERVKKIFEEEYNSSTNSYEKQCREHIDNFMNGVEKYARETQLSKRVSQWTNKLEPILRAQELIPPYDIHQYADTILMKVNHITLINSKSSNNKKSKDIKFDEIVKGQNNAEVCRVFLACLQLANMGNLQVCQPEKVSNENGSIPIFSLKLLNSKTRKIEFENFLCPSLALTDIE